MSVLHIFCLNQCCPLVQLLPAWGKQFSAPLFPSARQRKSKNGGERGFKTIAFFPLLLKAKLFLCSSSGLEGSTPSPLFTFLGATGVCISLLPTLASASQTGLELMSTEHFEYLRVLQTTPRTVSKPRITQTAWKSEYRVFLSHCSSSVYICVSIPLLWFQGFCIHFNCICPCICLQYMPCCISRY